MKTKNIDHLILLEQSGELSAQQKRLLDTCPEAQAKRDEFAALSAAFSPSGAEPSPWATTKITAQLRASRRRGLIPARVWTPIVAMAACLTLVVSIIDFKPVPYQNSVDVVMAEMDVWDTQFDADLVELENLIQAISGDPLDIMEM
jgi:ferric-dicitrate binding protein FerR (iron transport regulator)